MINTILYLEQLFQFLLCSLAQKFSAVDTFLYISCKQGKQYGCNAEVCSAPDLNLNEHFETWFQEGPIIIRKTFFSVKILKMS